VRSSEAGEKQKDVTTETQRSQKGKGRSQDPEFRSQGE
jgi:hypothetical protein